MTNGSQEPLVSTPTTKRKSDAYEGTSSKKVKNVNFMLLKVKQTLR